MKLPWTCPRCGSEIFGYGNCRSTPECDQIADTLYQMRKVLDLARLIDPTLPPDQELETKELRITMSKDFLGVEVLDSSIAGGV